MRYILIIAALLVGCDRSPTLPPAAILVLDDTTDDPIEGAYVDMDVSQRHRPIEWLRGYTDEEGKFYYPSEKYILSMTVKKEGYFPTCYWEIERIIRLKPDVDGVGRKCQ